MTNDERLKQIEKSLSQMYYYGQWHTMEQDILWLINRVKTLIDAGNKIVNNPILSSYLALASWNRAIDGKNGENNNV